MLKHIEGFEQYGTSDGTQVSGLNSRYDGAVIAAGTRVQPGRIAGKCLSHGGTLELTFTTPNLGNMATVVVGFGFSTASKAIPYRIIGLREDDDATDGINLRLTATGALEIRLANTLIATSVSTPIAINTWYFVEMKVLVANAGTYEVRVNGLNVLSGNADTRAGSNDFANRLRFGNGSAGYGSGSTVRYDDLYICDGTGTNGDFLGDRVCITIFPDSAGDSTDFTPLSGSNYENVDDNPHDGDTSYVESATIGHLDLYNFANVNLLDIVGVQINAVVRKTDSTDFDANLVVKSGGTTDSGIATTVSSTDYVTVSRVLEENPDTSLAWVDTEVNSAQFGIEVD